MEVTGGVDRPRAGVLDGPLHAATQQPRYARQLLLREYEDQFNCRCAVLIGELAHYSITLFEDLLHGARGDDDLHLLLDTPGGDGESAIRLVRQAQSRCRELTVIVPDQAKSAGTLLALGAHVILMGPTSDLGPIDPQFRMDDGAWAAAKSIIAAVEHAEEQVLAVPETGPFHATMLEGVSALKVQQAREAIARTRAQLDEALASHPGRAPADVEALAKRLSSSLIVEPQSHAAVVSGGRARDLGLPVTELTADDPQWNLIWRMWAGYFALAEDSIYESSTASHVYSTQLDE